VPAERTIPDRNGLNLSWLIKLRWSSIAGQAATILGVHALLGLAIPLAPLLAIVAVEALSNIACGVWLGRRRGAGVAEWHLAAIMALDIVFLTGLLYLTGGPFNPFSFLYLVNIALAAVALHAQWTWMLAALALLSFGLLPLVDYRELPIAALGPAEQVNLYQQGTWVAFGVAAGFIVHFLWRVTGALSQRDGELGQARAAAARQEQLASLATMAAGAAHELATPLGTIALVAKELERAMAARGPSAALDDARLIRAEVGRCRLILDQMAGGVGKSAEQSVEEVSLEALMEEARTGVRDAPVVELDFNGCPGSTPMRLPPRAVAQALRGLITNAQDAARQDGGDAAVEVSAWVAHRALTVEVQDHGAGMPPEVLARVGEPFFTTKPPGRGMGLGLYLARAVVERLGGQLDIESAPTAGTRVRVTIPAEVDALAPASPERHGERQALHPDR
jgi:two-component system sensor histidine kinase RegB